MLRTVLIPAAVLFLVSAAQPALAQKKQSKSEPKFLDEITAEAVPLQTSTGPTTPPSKNTSSEPLFAIKNAPATLKNTASTDIEKAGPLQIKFALLMDTEVEQVQNIELFELIDEWYGTRYRLGGNSKSGIDCSAFVQVLYSDVYGVHMPRTAREQHKTARAISRTELREGDLVFFNTRGGVSHVGIYLQNNKFVHASSSGGVMISDLMDQYWMRKFIGVGRVEKAEKQEKDPSLISRL